jgi:hypothetical protein
MPERAAGLPTVFKVRHPALKQRRYIGAFAWRGPGGELIWMPEPTPRLSGRFEIDIVDDGPGPFRSAVIHLGPSRHRVVIYHHGSNLREGAVRGILRSLFAGGGAQVFLGQDAEMIRGCMRTALDGDLGGEPFEVPIEVHEAADTPTASPGFVQVLRNGSVLADASIIVEDEGDADWWRRP